MKGTCVSGLQKAVKKYLPCHSFEYLDQYLVSIPWSKVILTMGFFFGAFGPCCRLLCCDGAPEDGMEIRVIPASGRRVHCRLLIKQLKILVVYNQCIVNGVQYDKNNATNCTFRGSAHGYDVFWENKFLAVNTLFYSLTPFFKESFCMIYKDYDIVNNVFIYVYIYFNVLYVYRV